MLFILFVESTTLVFLIKKLLFPENHVLSTRKNTSFSRKLTQKKRKGDTMSMQTTASLIFSILASLGVGYILYRVLNIEDFIHLKITKKFNSIAGHKGKALIKAREAATEDMRDLIFQVPEIKQIFPKLNTQTMMGANADPSMFAGGMLGAFSDLAPLLGMVQGEDFSIIQLIPILIQIVPKVVEFLANRRKKLPAKTPEEIKDEKAIPTTAKLTY